MNEICNNARNTAVSNPGLEPPGMGSPDSNAPAARPICVDAGRGDLLVHIGNLPEFAAAYGADCVGQVVRGALESRLEPFGIEAGHISSAGEHVAVDLAQVHIPNTVSDDLFLERVKAALSCLPVECGESRILLNVFVTLGAAGQFKALPAGQQAWRADQASPEAVSRQHVAYRDDMATAVSFFEQVRAGMVVLAFQPVVVAGREQENIYSESLLRRLVVDGEGLASCTMEIQALERLGLIDRLDRSVLWAVIETLESNPTVRLGCNLSALSLRHDGWWRLLQSYFAKNRDVAERLTLEVTETVAISQSDEAANLLRTLSLLGCRIALDDMGAGFSTVDFLLKTRPDIVKIDRAFVTNSPEQRQRQPPHLLRHLIALCSDLSTCVVAEGVESEDEWNTVVNAGVHGVQGYFIERPTILPHWLKTPVTVRDSFAAGHRGLSARM